MTGDTLLARTRRTNWKPDPKTMLFFNGEEHLYGMEEFRTLRSRLYQAREKHPLSKVLVTSPLPKEGKSFVTANLGQVLVQQQGKRVLLVDADLRNPHLHLTLGAEAGPGPFGLSALRSRRVFGHSGRPHGEPFPDTRRQPKRKSRGVSGQRTHEHFAESLATAV